MDLKAGYRFVHTRTKYLVFFYSFEGRIWRSLTTTTAVVYMHIYRSGKGGEEPAM